MSAERCGTCNSCIQGQPWCEDPIGSPSMTPDEVDAITEAIKTGRYPWCRARLLAALATAENQEILGDVLDELLGVAGENIGERMRDALHRQGWL